MLIIPSIDIMEGKCVRLRRGQESEKTVFSSTPVAVARVWERLGARLVHVVDLDGAFKGKPVNIDVIRDMARNLKTPVQAGGGIRNMDDLNTVFQAGASQVVLGTAAISDPSFLQQACAAYPGKVLASIDLKAGRAAVMGWKETTSEPIPQIMKRFKESGVVRVVFTDTARDGMLGGIDPAVVRTVLGHDLKVIAGGGVTSYEDVAVLKQMEPEGIEGVIIGRALYSGGLKLERLIAMFQEPAGCG